ncbi:FAD binding domain protein, partial [Vibrio parahaemolyticus V-223/04]
RTAPCLAIKSTKLACCLLPTTAELA